MLINIKNLGAGMMRGWKLKASFVALVGCSLLFIALPTQGALLPCGPDAPPAPGRDNVSGCSLEDLQTLAVDIYNFLLGMSAMIAFLFIVWGGVRMLYWTFMEDSAQELEGAKYTVRRAIGGFLIILMAYLLVNTLLIVLGVDSSSALGKMLQSLGFFK